MNKCWHTFCTCTCTKNTQQKVTTWSSFFFFFLHLTLTSFQEPETGVWHLYNIPVPTYVTSEDGSSLCAETTVVQLIHFLTSLQNLLVFKRYTFNKYCRKSNPNWDSNSGPLTYQTNAPTPELTRPNGLNVTHLLIRWQTNSSHHLHNSNSHCLNYTVRWT